MEDRLEAAADPVPNMTVKGDAVSLGKAARETALSPFCSISGSNIGFIKVLKMGLTMGRVNIKWGE